MAALVTSCATAFAQTMISASQSPAEAGGHDQAPEPQYPIVSVGVLSYVQYDAELEHRDSFNAFDLTRGYINITADVVKNVRFRITPDVRRISDGSLSGSLVYRIKYAFAEFDNVLGDKSWLRFGVHQTPWLDFEESINRYRVQGTMFSEREAVIPSSGDFGIGYFAPLPGGYGEINVGVYNGEGSARGEANKFKSFQGRGTIRPFPNAPLAKGLRLSAFYDLGSYSADHPRRHGIVMASFDHTHLVGTVQWLAGTDRPELAAASAHPRGASAFVEVRQGLEGWAAIARVEQFDPDRLTPDNSDRRLIGGIAYWLKWSRSRVGLVVDDEDVRYDSGQRKPHENRLLVQTHIQF